MVKSEKPQGKVKITPADGRGSGCLPGFLLTTAVILAILLVAFFLLVRTEGGKETIRGMLSSRLGFEVDARRTRIGWPYALVIEGIVSRDTLPSGEPLFAAREIRVALGIRPRLRIRVRNSGLNLVQGEDSDWRPASLRRLGDLPLENIVEITGLTSGLREKARIEIADSSIRWIDVDGKLMAAARGMTFRVSPIRLPNRRMYHYHLEIYDVLAPDASRVHDIQREWLASDTRDYVEIGRSGRETAALQSGFWEARE